MSTTVQPFSLTGFEALQTSTSGRSLEQLEAIYEANRHRVYSLAFWMTDNEISAEEISARVFYRVFSHSNEPSVEAIDNTLLQEFRELAPIGQLTLECTSTSQGSMRQNLKRVHLERAVVQLPTTERLAFLLHDVEGYDHWRIANLLGISREESQMAVYQARVFIREAAANMK